MYVCRGAILVERRRFREGEEAALDEAGALLPTYAADDTIMVALPEVRAEGAALSQLQAFVDAERDIDPKSVKVRGERVSFAPRSKRGADALKIANKLQQKVKGASATPRFVRVVPRGGKSR